MIKNYEYYLYVKPENKEIETPDQITTIKLGRDVKRRSPVIIKSQDKYFREVTFFERDNRKLLNTETLEIKSEEGHVYTTYDDIVIEESSHQLNKNEGNEYLVDGEFNKGDTVEISYYLKNSFIVYTNNNNESFAMIYTDYSTVNITYETDNTSPFYDATKQILPNGVEDNINFNSHYNDFNSSFVFITDREYKDVDIKITPIKKDLFIRSDCSNYKTSIFKAKVVDKFGNPVFTDSINISADKGSVEFFTKNIDDNMDNKNDMYGNVYIQYEPPSINDDTTDTIFISSTNVSKEYTINLHNIELPKEVSIIFPYHKERRITEDDTLVIWAIAKDQHLNNKPGEYIYLQIRDSDTNELITTKSKTTDSQGIAKLYFRYSGLSKNQVKNMHVIAFLDDAQQKQEFEVIGV